MQVSLDGRLIGLANADDGCRIRTGDLPATARTRHLVRRRHRRHVNGSALPITELKATCNWRDPVTLTFDFLTSWHVDVLPCAYHVWC